MPTILVTGAHGFIGKNLCVKLGENPDYKVLTFCRGQSNQSLGELVGLSDVIVHLAGENRPKDEHLYMQVNLGLTEEICRAVVQSGKKIPIIFSSSSQATLDNTYGVSKKAAEDRLHDLFLKTGNPVLIYRYPGVFGKWCRPNYNSVVATFCHNVARSLPIAVNAPDKQLQLVYIDDLVDQLVEKITVGFDGFGFGEVTPVYEISLQGLADQIIAFRQSRQTLLSEQVGCGLVRALYATYISYLPTESFCYELPVYADNRGSFVEMIKTKDSGQFSFFTSGPGVTRGEHYHHTKTEKFLVVQGTARFGFRSLQTGERCYLEVCGTKPQIVETIPGWAHNITNVGTQEMIVMLWANEIFDRQKPDTIAAKVEHAED